MGLDQAAHARVALAARTTSQHDRNNLTLASLDRGHEVEPGRVRKAGLDAVDPLHPPEQVVVVAHRAALVDEARGREVAVVARKTLLDSKAKQSLVACGRDLLVVRKAGGVAVDRLVHAERACLAGHLAGEFGLAAGQRFGHYDCCVVGRLCDKPFDRIFDRQRLAGLETKLGRRLHGGLGGNAHLGRKAHPPGFNLLEQQIERHDLGERCRMAQRIGARLMQRRTGLGVDHDRGIARTIGLGLDRALDRLALASLLCVGRIGQGRQREDRSKTQTSPTEPAGGSDR